MKPRARLVVIEAFFAEPGEPKPADMIDTQVPLFDLHLMLAGNGKGAEPRRVQRPVRKGPSSHDQGYAARQWLRRH